jgi:hypothetical protein
MDIQMLLVFRQRIQPDSLENCARMILNGKCILQKQESIHLMNFLWYEGTSARDGISGQWILYHSHEFQEKVLQIDWEKESDQIASLTYTAVRELKDDRTTEPFKGSYLTYGLQEGDYNAFYNVHFYDIWTTSFVDAYIDWSTTEYNGRVKAQYHFQDTEWHCWDNSGADALCN